MTRTMNLYINPMLAWNKLAWRTGEMMLTSSQVIMQRSRIAAPGSGYSEAQLMGQEKIDAMLESAQAVTAQMIMMGHQFTSIACRQILSASSNLLAIASSKTTSESLNRQSKLITDSLNHSVIAGSKLSASAEKVARSALQPVKKRADKNARRLVKHK